jgi:hypothetical protein
MVLVLYIYSYQFCQEFFIGEVKNPWRGKEVPQGRGQEIFLLLRLK